MGATGVTALEKEPVWQPPPPGVKLVTVRFEDYHETGPWDVGVISWPRNQKLEPALVRLAAQCDVLIYIGKNTDYTSCGSVDLMDHMQRRELLAYKPDHRNSLIITGRPLHMLRAPTGEEIACLTAWKGHRSYSVEEAEELALHVAAKFEGVDAYIAKFYGGQ
jgi:hypothetical protein